jgi:hypothetical protein
MTAPQITQRITDVDNVELVRDRIADILSAESISQQQKATAASADPKQYKLQVYTERSTPWQHWLDSPDPETNTDARSDTAPIINVCFDRDDIDRKASNSVSRQKMTALFNIDCFGYAVSRGKSGGHVPGDQAAGIEAMRAARLVRKILMAGTYTYLGFPRQSTGAEQVVWSRMVISRQAFRLGEVAQPVQDVAGVRIVFEVGFSEFSPQVEGQLLEAITVTFVRAEGTPEGLILATAEYPPASP